MDSQDQATRDALRQVRQLRHFYRHLMTYAVVITFLHIINLITSDTYWAFWPALGWGIAIVLHALRTSQISPFFGADWEDRQVQKILAKRAS